MLLHRRRGFTLIELLVVIAIIGILAAMLFPVFARARESARKTQCLANVKNIAMGIQLYLTDYDGFMPVGESDKTAMDYFVSVNPSVGTRCNHQRQANPYLREPVILDEYIKSREIWRCPSALVMTAAGNIVPEGRDGYWLNNWRDVTWKDAAGMPQACDIAWPSGWGGSVTDSFVQGLATSNSPGVFMAGIGINDNMHWDRPSSVNDSAQYIVCGDAGSVYNIWNAKTVAYPDYACSINQCGFDNVGCCGTGDGSTPGTLTTDQKKKAITDTNYRRSLARHMGGSNVGFMDGHAKWFTGETLIFQQKPHDSAIFEGGLCDCPDNWVPGW